MKKTRGINMKDISFRMLSSPWSSLGPSQYSEPTLSPQRTATTEFCHYFPISGDSDKDKFIIPAQAMVQWAEQISAKVGDDIESRLHRIEQKIDSLLCSFRQDIERQANICGGAARIKGTRIPIWTLENLRRQGFSEAEILDSYPSLKARDLVTAWDYVAANFNEINTLIIVNDAD
jgi:uncharacterized protein (DUF433 family)